MILDYTYQFDQQYSRAVNVPLNKNGFDWPESDWSYDTVFLKLRIKPAARKLFLPYLEISTKAKQFKQYLERKNEGIRYFNLSALAGSISGGEKVFLKSNHLKWDDQAELIFFNNEIKQDEKVLVISPHPDDAELAAFNFYKKHDSCVVTITAGEGGKNYFHEFYPENKMQQSKLKAKLRIFDSRCIPFLGGASFDRTLNLGYFDDTLEEMYQNKMKSARSASAGVDDIRQFRSYDEKSWTLPVDGKASWSNLIHDLKNILEQFNPTIIVLPHPTLDKNKDHQFSSKAVVESLSTTHLKNIKFLFYVNHSVLTERYPYGPTQTPITLPPNFNHFKVQCGIFSYPVLRDDLILKTFALGAMHDLREIPFRKKWISRKYKHYYSFRDAYRKALRDNELFIVMSAEKAKEWIDAV